MSFAPRPPDEAERLAALGRYDILDTLPEQAFDDLTLLAADICNAPIAYLGFIDRDRTWFKSKVGLTIQEIPRYVNFCAHAILDNDLCIVPDALADERFANNPLVTSEPHIRFSAAAQLVTPDGHAIGTLCVVDHVPRDLSSEQEEALRVLARQVMAQLELWCHLSSLEHGRDITERKQVEEALRQAHDEMEKRVESERRLATTQRVAQLGSWEWDITTNKLAWSDELYRVFGLPQQAFGGTYESFLDLIHPDDREKVERIVQKALTNLSRYQVEFRVIHPGGEVRVISAQGEVFADETGRAIKVIDISQDITERVRAREARMQLQLRLLAAQEEERRRISRELHDQLGQHLPALMVGIKTLRDANQSGTLADERLQQLQDLAERIARDAHRLARDLRPPVLDDFGLPTALSNYLEEWSARYGIAADFHSVGFNEDERLPPHIEITLYRTVQEALTNVIKHAQAEHVSLILRRSHEGLLANLEDDGIGFDAEAERNTPISEGRLGLLGMEERVELVGGTLEVESTPGAGTTVAIRIPTLTSKGGSTYGQIEDSPGGRPSGDARRFEDAD